MSWYAPSVSYTPPSAFSIRSPVGRGGLESVSVGSSVSAVTGALPIRVLDVIGVVGGCAQAPGLAAYGPPTETTASHRRCHPDASSAGRGRGVADGVRTRWVSGRIAADWAFGPSIVGTSFRTWSTNSRDGAGDEDGLALHHRGQFEDHEQYRILITESHGAVLCSVIASL